MPAINFEKKFQKILKTNYELEAVFHKTFRNFLIICQIFCAAPALVHTGNHHHHEGSNLQRIIRNIHKLWCVIMLGGIITSTYYQYVINDDKLPAVQKAIYISEYASNVLNVLIIILGSYRQKELYQHFVQKLVQIDQKLKRYNVQASFKALSKFILTHVIGFIFFFGCTMFVDYFYSTENIHNFFRSCMVYTTSNAIMVLSLSQYRSVLFCIQQRFNRINFVIASMTNAGQIDFIKTKNNERNKSKIVFVKTISSNNEICNKTTTTNNSKNNNSSYGSDIHFDLNYLRLAFSDLEILTGQVTKAFGFLVLMTFVGSFLILSIQVFQFYTYLDIRTIPNTDIPLLLYTILWIILHGGKILLILQSNNTIVAEKGYTALILNDLESQSSHTETLINRFLLQLMVKNRVRTVCGVIELDLIYLGAVLTALSTYVIFLIEYDLSIKELAIS